MIDLEWYPGSLSAPKYNIKTFYSFATMLNLLSMVMAMFRCIVKCPSSKDLNIVNNQSFVLAIQIFPNKPYMRYLDVTPGFPECFPWFVCSQKPNYSASRLNLLACSVLTRFFIRNAYLDLEVSFSLIWFYTLLFWSIGGWINSSESHLRRPHAHIDMVGSWWMDITYQCHSRHWCSYFFLFVPKWSEDVFSTHRTSMVHNHQ